MKRILRFLSLGGLVLVLVFWVSAGANRGWTKTSVDVPQVDPITEIEFFVREDRFVPGVDILAGSVIVFGVILIVSFFVGGPSGRRR